MLISDSPISQKNLTRLDYYKKVMESETFDTIAHTYGCMLITIYSVCYHYY